MNIQRLLIQQKKISCVYDYTDITPCPSRVYDVLTFGFLVLFFFGFCIIRSYIVYIYWRYRCYINVILLLYRAAT